MMQTFLRGDAAGDTPAWLRPLLADLEQDPSCLRQWLRLFVRFPGGIHRFFGASPTHLQRHLDTLYAPVGDIDTTVGGADGCQSN